MKKPRLDALQIQVAGYASAAALLMAGGFTVAANVAATPTAAVTRTVHHTRVETHTHNVTVKARGRVLRRVGGTLVVYIPRMVVDGHVIPAHIIRIRRRPPATGGGVTIVPPAVTVTVPVPGPTVTVTAPPVTVTVPAVTVTVPVTVTDTDPGHS